MSSAFEQLPLEVFTLIADHLSLPEYQALRITSQRLNSLSFSSFSKRFFSELTTTLGSSSLNRLVLIANDRYFSGTVNVLEIKLLNHRDYKILKSVNRVGIWPPPKRFPKVPGVNTRYIGEECFLYDDVFSRDYPRCIVDRLVSSLRGFLNLTTIRFRAYHTEPLGWTTGAMPDGDQLFRLKCFQAVLDAILQSEIQLGEFSLAKRPKTTHLSKSANLPYTSIQLPFTSLAGVRHCFSHLQSLTLTIVSAYNGDSRVPGWENSLSNIIACAPHLKNLTLSLDRKARISHYSAAIIRSLALSCQLAGLESFHLSNCTLHQTDLAKFLISHAMTITQIILADVRLLSGDWPSLWISLLELQALRFLRLVSLDGTRSPVMFRKKDKEKLKINLDAGKSSRSMHDLINDLVTACNLDIEYATMGEGFD